MPTLVRIDAFDPQANAAVVLRAGSHDDVDTCHAENALWWPAAAKLPTLRYDYFDGAFGGAITAPAASVTLRTEPWADFARYRLAGARVRLYVRDDDGSWPVRFDGRITAEPKSGDGAADIAFAVDDSWLDTPLLALYAGTTGIEGPAELKGQPKPLALGAPRYVPGKLIDSVNLVWQLSAYGPVEGVEMALERLARLGDSVGDHPTLAALIAADIPNGGWATCNALGLVRFGAPTDGQVSFLLKGDKAGAGGWVRKPGALIRRLAELAGGGDRVDTASLAALDVARPYNLSLYLDQQTTARQLIQSIAASVNAVALVTWLGKLVVLPVAIGAPTLELQADGSALPPVRSSSKVDIAPPFKKLAITAARTWAVHALSDVALAATLIERGPYDSSEQYREGHIVNTPDGSRWRYIVAEPSVGVEPVDGSPVWRLLQGPITEIGGEPIENLIDPDIITPKNIAQILRPRVDAQDALWEVLSSSAVIAAAAAGSPIANAVSTAMMARASASLLLGPIFADPNTASAIDFADLNARLEAVDQALAALDLLVKEGAPAGSDVGGIPAQEIAQQSQDSRDYQAAQARTADELIAAGALNWRAQQRVAQQLSEWAVAMEALLDRAARLARNPGAVRSSFDALYTMLRDSSPVFAAPGADPVLIDKTQWAAKRAAYTAAVKALTDSLDKLTVGLENRAIGDWSFTGIQRADASGTGVGFGYTKAAYRSPQIAVKFKKGRVWIGLRKPTDPMDGNTATLVYGMRLRLSDNKVFIKVEGADVEYSTEVWPTGVPVSLAMYDNGTEQTVRFEVKGSAIPGASAQNGTPGQNWVPVIILEDGVSAFEELSLVAASPIQYTAVVGGPPANASAGSNLVRPDTQVSGATPTADGWGYTFAGNNAKVYLVGTEGRPVPADGSEYLNVTVQTREDTGVGEAFVHALFYTAGGALTAKSVDARKGGGPIEVPPATASYIIVQGANFTAGSIEMTRAVVVSAQYRDIDPTKVAVNTSDTGTDIGFAWVMPFHTHRDPVRPALDPDAGLALFYPGDPSGTLSAQAVTTKYIVIGGAHATAGRVTGYTPLALSGGGTEMMPVYGAPSGPIGGALVLTITLSGPAGTETKSYPLFENNTGQSYAGEVIENTRLESGALSYSSISAALVNTITGDPSDYVFAASPPSIVLRNHMGLADSDPARDAQVQGVAIVNVPAVENPQRQPSFYVNNVSEQKESIRDSVLGLIASSGSPFFTVVSTPVRRGLIDGSFVAGHTSTVEQTATDIGNIVYKRTGSVDMATGAGNTWSAWAKSLDNANAKPVVDAGDIKLDAGRAATVPLIETSKGKSAQTDVLIGAGTLAYKSSVSFDTEVASLPLAIQPSSFFPSGYLKASTIYHTAGAKNLDAYFPEDIGSNRTQNNRSASSDVLVGAGTGAYANTLGDLDPTQNTKLNAGLDAGGNLISGIKGGPASGVTKISDLVGNIVGTQLHLDPEFSRPDTVNNTVYVYDNSGSGKTTLARVVGAAPNGSGAFLRISYDGTGSEGSYPQGPTPGWGGYHTYLQDAGDSQRSRPGYYRRGSYIYYAITARIPVGREINFHSNAIGSDAAVSWQTSQQGTGDWYRYVFRVRIGTVGSFASTGYFAVHNGPNTAFQWDVARHDIIEWQGSTIYAGQALRDEGGAALPGAAIRTSVGKSAQTDVLIGAGTLAYRSSIEDGYLSGNLAARLAPHPLNAAYLTAVTIAYPGGAGLDAKEPEEGGSNKTETRKSAKTDLLIGAGTGAYASTLAQMNPGEGAKFAGIESGATAGATIGGNVKRADGQMVPSNDLLNYGNDNSTLSIDRPQGGAMGSTASAVTGAIMISLPVATQTFHSMIRFRIELYEYVHKRAVTYEVAGYTYPPEARWVNVEARMIGGASAARPVRFGRRAGDPRLRIWIGDLDTVWHHVSVVVKDLTVAYSSIDADPWRQGWAVEMDTVGWTGNLSYTEERPNAGDALFGENVREAPDVPATLANFKTGLGKSAQTEVLVGAGALAYQSTVAFNSQIAGLPYGLGDLIYGGYINAARVAWVGGDVVQAFKPQEAGANQTETRKSAQTDLLVGAGLFAYKSKASWNGDLSDVPITRLFSRNLMDTSPIEAGGGFTNTYAVGNFRANDERCNSLVTRIGPFGVAETVLKMTEVDTGSATASGGWNYNFFSVDGFDARKSYRYAMYFMREAGSDGSIYLGIQGNVKHLDGAENSNFYFWITSAAALTPGKWYVAVGIAHGSDYAGGQSGLSGIYDPETGQKLTIGAGSSGGSYGSDCKLFQTDGSGHRAYQYYSSQGSTAYLARPSIVEISGSSPSLSDLMLNGANLNSNQRFDMVVPGYGRPENNADVTAGKKSASTDLLIGAGTGAYASNLTQLNATEGNKLAGSAAGATANLSLEQTYAHNGVYCSIEGNKVTGPTGGGSWWTFVRSRSYIRGACEVRARSNGVSAMFGLTTVTNAAGDQYVGLKYAWYPYGGGLQVYEQGAYRADFPNGTVVNGVTVSQALELEVRDTGSQVEYWAGGKLFYTSPQPYVKDEVRWAAVTPTPNAVVSEITFAPYSDVTADNQIGVPFVPTVLLPSRYNGEVDGDQLPYSYQMSFNVGDNDLTSQVPWEIVASQSVNVSINNTAGPSRGLFTITAVTANVAQFTIRASYQGRQITRTVKILKQLRAAAETDYETKSLMTRGGAAFNSAYPYDNASNQIPYKEAYPTNNDFQVTTPASTAQVGSDGKLYVNGTVTFVQYSSGGSVQPQYVQAQTAYFRLQYSTDNASWNDFTGEVQAQVPAKMWLGQGNPEQIGTWTVSAVYTGFSPNQTLYVRLIARAPKHPAPYTDRDSYQSTPELRVAVSDANPINFRRLK